jgi:hypothetical protein
VSRRACFDTLYAAMEFGAPVGHSPFSKDLYLYVRRRERHAQRDFCRYEASKPPIIADCVGPVNEVRCGETIGIQAQLRNVVLMQDAHVIAA